MHSLFKLFNVLLLSFFIIMAAADGSDTPRRSGRLSENNNNNDGTEAEQFDAIERVAREAALLTTATETDPPQQQNDALRFE